MLYRCLEDSITKRLDDNKAIILYGARQVGKSTLLDQLAPKLAKPQLWLNGDDADTRSILASSNATRLKALLGKTRTLIIDEAQRIPDIGLTIKIILDQIPGIKVIATGSSSFELGNQINEPLTGRKWEYHLFPLSYEELVTHTSPLEEQRLLEQRLIFGSYPEIVTHPGDENERLKLLADSYLYKDILISEQLKKPEKLEKLLQALAYQVGNQVSYNELSGLTGLDNKTVEKYIQILERAYIVFRLPSFSRNLRSELKKSRKIYFYDNGLRNAVINQFAPLAIRNDVGALWENYMISERLKACAYHRLYTNQYFWRTRSQQEIDLVEDRDGKIYAYECKWNAAKANGGRAFRFPDSFVAAYNPEERKVITPESYHDFLLEF